MRLSIYDEKINGHIAHFEVDAVLSQQGELTGPDTTEAIPEEFKDFLCVWFPIKLARNDHWTRLAICPRYQWMEVGGVRMPMGWTGGSDPEYFAERYDRMTAEGWDRVDV